MRAHLIVLGLLVGCAPMTSVGPVKPAPRLVHGGGGADVDQLVADFYGAGLLPPQALARAAEVLRAHPHAARAHEVAALASLLLGDGEGSRRHFLEAAADLDGDATALYLWELGWQPRSEELVTMQLLDELRRNHPRAHVRADAAMSLAWLANRQGRVGEASEIARSLGFIRDWQILGALENDQGKGFLTSYPPESKIDLAAEVPGPLVPLKWRRVEHMTPLGAVPLMHLLWPREFAVAYLATWVHSDGERAAQLRITASAPTRAFVNDGLVLSEEQVANADFDNLIAPITLHAGWNQILIKSANRRASWQVHARISDPEGAPLNGLTYSVVPQKYLPGPARDNPDTLGDSVPAGPDGRKRFLESRLATRAGRSRPALAAMQELLDQNPKNPLALYFGALAYWGNDELGKTIDLLNQGVDATGAAAFLTKRGSYYQQKQLWEKAQTDLLKAVALDERARVARVQLADLYERRGWHVDRCRVLDELLKRAPDDAYALRERGECADALGYPEQAEELLERAARLTPGDDEIATKRMELARRRGNFADARRRIAELERLWPSSPGFLLDEGDLLRRKGDLDGARARFVAAAELAPQFPRPWERLGNLAYERGHNDEALTAWKNAHERDPNNSSLAQRIEFLEPTKLGFIEKLVPTEAEIDHALNLHPKPRAGAQIALLLDHEVTEVNADGSARSVATRVSQALDDKGRDEMTHEHLPTWGTLKILRAYAINEKGERQEAASIRGGEVRFRALTAGAKTVIQYVQYVPVSPILHGGFMNQWYLQTVGRQNEDSTWVLVLPRGRSLHLEVTGDVKEKRWVEGDRELRSFHAAHVSPLVSELHMPPADDLLSQVDVSTVESWDDYVRWERALLVDAFHSNSSLDALTDKLLAEAKSPREKLDKLFHHVEQEIRYQQDYETTIAGVRPHAASAVVERGYGDCKDKAVLLIQMARRAGLKLHFALLKTTNQGRLRKEVPTLQFNHAIVWVPPQEGITEGFFADPTAEGLDMGNLPAEDQGALSLVTDPESGHWEFREIPFQAPELQFDRHKVRIEVKSPTVANAVDEIALRGSLAMGLRHVLRNEGEARKLFETITAALFPGTTMRDAKAGDKDDVWHPLSLTLEVDASQSLRPEEENTRLALPGNFQLASAVTLKKRETPLRLGAPDSDAWEIEATLPDGFQVVHAPKDFAVEHECFTLVRKSRVDGRKLSVQVQFARRCAEVAIGDYSAFRDAVLEAQHKLNDDLVFGKAPKKK